MANKKYENFYKTTPRGYLGYLLTNQVGEEIELEREGIGFRIIHNLFRRKKNRKIQINWF